MRTDEKYMLNRSDFPGICVSVYNPDFNSGRFATINSQAGWNSHNLSFKEVEA